MMNRRYLLSMIALAGVLGAGVATAQEEQPQQAQRARMRIHEPGTGLQEGVTPMRRRMGRAGWEQGRGGPGPEAVLRQRELLDLTDAQVAELERMQAAQTAARTARREAMQSQREEFRALMAQDDPDPAAIRAATQARLDLQEQAVLGQLDAATAARALLTDEQRTKLRGFEEGFRQGMRGSRAMRGHQGPRGFDRGGRRGGERTRADMRRGPRPNRN
jgi:Spy/CpxP family protein refolding chaperone